MIKSAKSNNRAGLIIFIGITLFCGWGGVLVDHQIPEQPPGDSLGMLIWLIAPLLTIIGLLLTKQCQFRDLHSRPHLKGNLRWYFFSLLVFPAVALIVLLIGAATNWINFDSFSLSGVVGALLIGIVPSMIKNIIEEFSWRGYLTRATFRWIENDWFVYLVVGCVWGLWHLPYYLYMFPAYKLPLVWTGSRWSFAFLSILAMVCWSMQLIELRWLTNSLWPCVISHAVQNALLNPMMLDGYIQMALGKEFIIAPTIGLVSIALNLTLGLYLRKKRLRKMSLPEREA